MNAFLTGLSATALLLSFPGRSLKADIILPTAPKSGFEEGIIGPGGMKAATREDIFRDPNLKQSQQIRSRMEAASAAYGAGNFSEAERVIKAAIKDFPAEPTVQVSLARFYYAQRRFNDADTALHAALRLKESAFLYMDLGTLYAEGLNRPVEAVDYFYKASAQDPKLPGAHYALGQLLSKLGQYDQARKEYSEAVGLDPKNVLTVLGLARMEIQARQADSALQAYGKALQLSPGNASLLIEIADLYAATNHNKEALKDYELATEKAPSDSFVWTKLGMFFQTQGDSLAADRAYEKAFKLEPHSAVVLNNRAAIALESNSDLDNALRWSQEAVSLSPKNAYFLDTYGSILHHSQKLKEAKASFEKAISLDQKYPSARYHLALVDTDLGLLDQAQRTLTEALAIKGQFPERKRAEEILAQLSPKAILP